MFFCASYRARHANTTSPVSDVPSVRSSSARAADRTCSVAAGSGMAPLATTTIFSPALAGTRSTWNWRTRALTAITESARSNSSAVLRHFSGE